MSRFLLLNLEEFGLNQDITKTIQPFNAFCICCLDRKGPMFELKKCEHSDYLNGFDRPQLKQFNQLVCHQCHSILKKIKYFQAQILESYDIVLSGAFTETTINSKKLNNLTINKVVDDLCLLPDYKVFEDNSINENFDNEHADYCSAVQCNANIEQNFIQEIPNELIMEQNVHSEIQDSSHMEQDYTQDFTNDLDVEQNFNNEIEDGTMVNQNYSHELQDDLNIEQHFITSIDNNSNIDQNYTHDLQNDSNLEQNFVDDSSNVKQNFSKELQINSNIEQNYTDLLQSDINIEHNFSDEIDDRSNVEQHFSKELQMDSNVEQNYTNELQSNINIEQSFADDIDDGTDLNQNFRHELQIDSNMEQNYTHELQNDSNIVQSFSDEKGNNTNIEQCFSREVPNILNEEQNSMQNRFNKNIKTALEILERNNQSFVSLGSQLQFLNGEYLSFLEPSLLCKEILTDIPLVPAKDSSTDLEIGLLNNSKSLEIDIEGTDKIFYDSLGLSPELIGKEATDTDIIQNLNGSDLITPKIVVKKIITKAVKTKKKNISRKPNLANLVRRVQLTHEHLDKERVLQAQSNAYLRYKFRCETCIISFNYKDNLDDHIKRKHGPKGEHNVVCDICFQVIPDAGHVTEHNYRHYTRYECMRCDRQYHTRDEAMKHCFKNHCANNENLAAKPKRGKSKSIKI